MAKAHINFFDVSTYICADKDDLSFWTSIFQCSDTKDARVRVNITSQEEFMEFRKSFEAAAKVHFTVEQSRSTERFLWSKVFRCHHGTHKQRSGTKNPHKKTGLVYFLIGQPIFYRLWNVLYICIFF